MPDDARSGDDPGADFGADPGIEEARKHLAPVVDHLSDKYSAPPSHVSELVESVFEEIAADARVLITLPR